jgi:hypothetical protein
MPRCLPANRGRGARAYVNEYCVRGDLYVYGLPRGTLGMVGRLADSALAATSTITLDGHGFEANDAIVFRATEGGTLPGGLVAGTTYYVLRIDDATFQVSASPSGSAITLSSDGTNVLVAIALPFTQVIEFFSRWADSFFPGHAVPFVDPVPVLVKGLVAELSAKKCLQLAGHKAQSIDEAQVAAAAQLQRFAAGMPIRDATATAPTNLTRTATLVVTGTDPRGWGSGVLPDTLRRGRETI